MAELIDEHTLVLLVLGLAVFGVVGLPHVLGSRPLSYPIIYVVGGAALFAVPMGLTGPDPIEFSGVTETLTEIGVITALMGSGLAINRTVGWRGWNLTWRLLGITMPLTIAAVAGLGWAVLGMTFGAAILLGAALAPTDPVLASDVQIPAPRQEEEAGEVRFALTSEAGLNDGLAFPFTNLAILVAVHGVSPSGWLGEFLVIEMAYRLGVGVLGGIAVGRLLAWAIFSRRSPLTRISDGMIALAATFIAYSVTELVGGYGFLAVFVAALVIRRQERQHEYMEVMHQFTNQIERLLSAVILILFGGALVTGILGHLTWQAVVVAALIVFVVRPASGLLGLTGAEVSRAERAAISFFGIRGVGSFYYVAHASNQVEFIQVELVWAVVAAVVLISIVAHGVSASPAMAYLDRRVERA